MATVGEGQPSRSLPFGFLTTNLLRTADMSQSQFLYCPSWDPWRIGAKRLIRSKTGPVNQKAKSTQLGMIQNDQFQPQFEYKPAGLPRVRFASRAFVRTLRTREPLNEVEEVSPGFTLSRSKEEIEVLLGEEFFEKKEVVKPIVSNTPPKLETEDIIADLVEQISELTAIMEQLRRDHHTTHKQLEQEMDDKCKELQEEHEHKTRELKSCHIIEMAALEEQYKKELRTERATAQEKLAGMQKEYKYLKNAFRLYQDSISDEMEEKWLRRQAEWKKSERTEREKALLQQKQTLTRRFEIELEEHKKIIQNNSFMLDEAYQHEKEEFKKQHEENMKKITELNEKLGALEKELMEKNETLNDIASSLHNTELELRNEVPMLRSLDKLNSEPFYEPKLFPVLRLDVQSNKLLLYEKLTWKHKGSNNKTYILFQSKIKYT
ncbi:flagellum-associated coiled-coil domain-containing protein 1 isoform X2 [Hemicordylus capensis]|uniref:flagellum-associated coiled-coil domain-containing protein 1 isoform X2 n=1 Tax=Hemicordylus capensis TaxID=884348 RepID=UPI0023036242|nr:flagellum-associated coiled-coil domain-containing protein 1 isoform X2 [Hemicordylus capensis]